MAEDRIMRRRLRVKLTYIDLSLDETDTPSISVKIDSGPPTIRLKNPMFLVTTIVARSPENPPINVSKGYLSNVNAVTDDAR